MKTMFAIIMIASLLYSIFHNGVLINDRYTFTRRFKRLVVSSIVAVGLHVLLLVLLLLTLLTPLGVMAFVAYVLLILATPGIVRSHS